MPICYFWFDTGHNKSQAKVSREETTWKTSKNLGSVFDLHVYFIDCFTCTSCMISLGRSEDTEIFKKIVRNVEYSKSDSLRNFLTWPKFLVPFQKITCTRAYYVCPKLKSFTSQSPASLQAPRWILETWIRFNCVWATCHLVLWVPEPQVII